MKSGWRTYHLTGLASSPHCVYIHPLIPALCKIHFESHYNSSKLPLKILCYGFFIIYNFTDIPRSNIKAYYISLKLVFFTKSSWLLLCMQSSRCLQINFINTSYGLLILNHFFRLIGVYVTFCIISILTKIESFL